MLNAPVKRHPQVSTTMTTTTIQRNEQSPSYHWYGTSIVCWDSAEMIPVGALDHLTNVWLFLNEAYSHPIDASKLPAAVNVSVHASMVLYGPTDRSFCIWQLNTPVFTKDIHPGVSCMGRRVDLAAPEKIYVLTVVKKNGLLAYDNSIAIPKVTVDAMLPSVVALQMSCNMFPVLDTVTTPPRRVRLGYDQMKQMLIESQTNWDTKITAEVDRLGDLIMEEVLESKIRGTLKKFMIELETGFTDAEEVESVVRLLGADFEALEVEQCINLDKYTIRAWKKPGV